MGERQRGDKDDIMTLCLELSVDQITTRYVKYEYNKNASCDRLLAEVHYNQNQPKSNWTPG